MSLGTLIFAAAGRCRSALGYQLPRVGPWLYRGFFKLVPEVVDTELFPGVRFRADLRDDLMRATWWMGTRFEKPTPQILAHFAVEARAPVFFDIGSNYGFFSYWMHTRRADLVAHAFEPNPATFALLTETKERNRLDRLVGWNCGLGDSEGEFELRLGAGNSGLATFGHQPGCETATVHLARVKTFDVWRREVGLELPPEPRWIVKIDVEGFELHVLGGMREALAARAFMVLCIEVNAFNLQFCGAKPEDLFALLREAGYQRIEDSPYAGRWPTHRTENAFFVPIPR